MLTPKIEELFVWLKKNFEVIVIDTAPVGLVSDAFTLSRYADACIYVVRQRYTFKRQLNFIEELNTQKRLPKMGLLVNDVLVHGGSGYYGYGGRYGYGYGYGYGESYFEIEKRKKNNFFRKIKRTDS